MFNQASDPNSTYLKIYDNENSSNQRISPNLSQRNQIMGSDILLENVIAEYNEQETSNKMINEQKSHTANLISLVKNTPKSSNFNNHNEQNKLKNQTHDVNVVTETKSQNSLTINKSSWFQPQLKSSVPIKMCTNQVIHSIIDATYHDPFRPYYESLEGVAFIRNPDKYAKFRCIECGKYLRNWDSVCCHINMHRHVRPYQCPICEKNYANKSGLKRHATLKHNFNQSAYKCALCKKSYSTTIGFDRHINYELTRNFRSSAMALTSEQYNNIITTVTNLELPEALDQIISN